MNAKKKKKDQMSNELRLPQQTGGGKNQEVARGLGGDPAAAPMVPKPRLGGENVFLSLSV